MTDYATENQRAAQQESGERFRRGPWQAVERALARRKADDDRRVAFEEAGAAGREQLIAAVRHPEIDNSPEAVAQRTEASRRAGQSEQQRRREHQSFRAGVAQEAAGSRNALDAALANHDTEAYAHWHSRLAALTAMLNELDESERTRQSLAAQPFFAGAVRA